MKETMSGGGAKDATACAGVEGMSCWKERVSNLLKPGGGVADVASRAELEHLRDLLDNFSLTLNSDSGNNGVFAEIANCFERACLLGAESVVSRSGGDTMEIHLPYISSLRLVYRNSLSNWAEERRGSDGPNSPAGSEQGASSSGEEEAGTDAESIDSGSISTICSYEGSVLATTYKQAQKSRLIRVEDEDPLYFRKTFTGRCQEIVSNNRMMDVITASDILAGSYLAVTWQPIAAYPRHTPGASASSYHVVYVVCSF